MHLQFRQVMYISFEVKDILGQNNMADSQYKTRGSKTPTTQSRVF